MSLESIIQEKLENLEKVPDSFIDVVDAQNEELYKEILKLLDSLEKNGDLIAISNKNISTAEQITELLKRTLFESDYLQGLKDFVNAFEDQSELINRIYAAQFDFEEKEIYNSLLQQSQKSTLSFLDSDAIGKAVFEPLQKNVITSIYSGAKYSDMVEGIREYILGADLDPKLTSYVKRYARDSMAIFDNTYTQLIAKDVDVKFWEYSGGTLKDSREFCLARVGNTYTKEEIRAWASKEWQGKNPNTTAETIFAYRGGYHCIHSFIPRATPE